MIYSGADLIRTSGQQQARAERLVANTPKVQPVDSKTSDLGGKDTGGALLRFAKFVKDHKQQKEREREKSKHPYIMVKRRHDGREDRGLILDIYA